METLKRKVGDLPQGPGVYLYKDAAGQTIYIGKAKNLRKRVQSYFTRDLSARTQALVARIADIEFISSPSEAQAQILEAALIKEKQPYYNISLKDDKSFPLIRITEERFPVVSLCRSKDRGRDDRRCRYFGPYTNARLLRQALQIIRRIFGFRTCATLPRKPCLYYRLKLCPAPCAGRITAAQYRERIGDIALFLDSRYEELLNRLTAEMKRAAEEKRYEDAAQLRDQMLALSAIGNCRKHFASPDESEDLRALIGLKRPPLRIEGFDIATLAGQEATGAMVHFYRGFPDKSNYRRFRIKTVRGSDDYAMIREVVNRRYARLTAERRRLPDLVLIDGGRQHLQAALEELRRLHVDIPVISIAKEEENIYVPGRNEPLRLDADTPALNLIRRIRDEAHRFARRYHHLLRQKKLLER